MTVNTNPSDAVYPLPLGWENYLPTQLGLTKRELFAGLALQGLLAKHGCDLRGDDIKEVVFYTDILIQELNKG